jgi:serine/threonine protein kinase
MNEEISYQEENFLKKPTVLKSRQKEKDIVIKFVYKFNDNLKQFEKNIDECKKKLQIASSQEKPIYTLKLKELELKKRDLEESLKNEKNIASMRHKNCLRINWFGDFINHFVYISEFCPNGDLASFQWQNLLRVNPSIKNLTWLKFMSEVLLSHFAVGVLSAIEFFKNAKLVHGNLSLDNILLSHNYSIKITDFVCSKLFINVDTFKLVKYDMEINREYQPPEYFRSDRYVDSRDAHKIDIFSFGCGLFYMATQNVLLEENAQKNTCVRMYL